MRIGRSQELGPRTIVLARFASPIAAEAAREALESIIEAASAEVAELFERRGGEAEAAEVAAIFTRHGLGDAIGWEVDHPIASRGTDIAWTLAPGADAGDAEELVRQLGAVNVAVQEIEGEDEEWRAAPHPMVLPVPGEEIDPFEGDDDEPASGDANRNRTLH
jgi:type VI protein secretion system component VasK